MSKCIAPGVKCDWLVDYVLYYDSQHSGYGATYEDVQSVVADQPLAKVEEIPGADASA